MTCDSLALQSEPFARQPGRALQRGLDTLQGGAGLLRLIFTLWLRSFRAGGVAALAKAVVWTLIWPLWVLYLIAFVGVRL
jgi:hypothetical protein